MNYVYRSFTIPLHCGRTIGNINGSNGSHGMFERFVSVFCISQFYHLVFLILDSIEFTAMSIGVVCANMLFVSKIELQNMLNLKYSHQNNYVHLCRDAHGSCVRVCVFAWCFVKTDYRNMILYLKYCYYFRRNLPNFHGIIPCATTITGVPSLNELATETKYSYLDIWHVCYDIPIPLKVLRSIG